MRWLCGWKALSGDECYVSVADTMKDRDVGKGGDGKRDIEQDYELVQKYSTRRKTECVTSTIAWFESPKP